MEMKEANKHGASDVKLAGWNGPQVQRAVQSLLKHVGKGDSGLLGDEDEVLYLQLALKKMTLQARKDKPVRLPLPSPLYSPEGQEICLFVKDHAGEGHKEAKNKLAQFERKGGVAKVVGLSKLKTKYESHESKRQLCKLYDLFLADERVLPSLPKLIGKSFFKKKKHPIPVDLTTKDFPAQVKKACAATYMFKTSGTCVNIRVARSSQGVDAICDNIYAVLVQAVQHIPKTWANIQGVFLKTADSVALPLFQTLPDAPAKISLTAAPASTAEIVSVTAAALKQPSEGAGKALAISGVVKKTGVSREAGKRPLAAKSLSVPSAKKLKE